MCFSLNTSLVVVMVVVLLQLALVLPRCRLSIPAHPFALRTLLQNHALWLLKPIFCYKRPFKTLIYIFSHNESWSKRRKVLPLTVFVSCAYFPLVERSLLCSSNLRYLLLHYCGQSRKLIVSLDGKWKVFIKLGWLFIYDVHRWLCEGMFPLSDLGVRWHCAG